MSVTQKFSAKFQGLLAQSVTARPRNGPEHPQDSQAAAERIYGRNVAMFRSLGRAAAAALMLGSAALLATPATASAQAAPVPMNVTPLAGLFHVITIAALPGLCLQPLTPTYRSTVAVKPCDGSAAQEWAILSTSSGGTHYRFLNNSGFCLSVDDGSTSGADAWLDECTVNSDPNSTTVSNAEWNASAPQPGAVTLQTRYGFVNHNLCLTDGVAIVLVTTCNGIPAQNWVIGVGG
jgi:hypothetical protein